MKLVALAIATGLGSGYFPVAPGTVGSALGALVYLLLRATGQPAAEWLAILVVLVVGAWASTEAEHIFKRTDPGQVVIDEVMGMLITVAGVPVNLTGLVLAFVAFRISDIVKPWPARYFERLPKGWGVMADDAMAAVYANLLMRLAAWMAPGLLLVPGSWP